MAHTSFCDRDDVMMIKLDSMYMFTDWEQAAAAKTRTAGVDATPTVRLLNHPLLPQL